MATHRGGDDWTTHHRLCDWPCNTSLGLIRTYSSRSLHTQRSRSNIVQCIFTKAFAPSGRVHRSKSSSPLKVNTTQRSKSKDILRGTLSLRMTMCELHFFLQRSSHCHGRTCGSLYAHNFGLRA